MHFGRGTAQPEYNDAYRRSSESTEGNVQVSDGSYRGTWLEDSLEPLEK